MFLRRNPFRSVMLKRKDDSFILWHVYSEYFTGEPGNLPWKRANMSCFRSSQT